MLGPEAADSYDSIPSEGPENGALPVKAHIGYISTILVLVAGFAYYGNMHGMEVYVFMCVSECACMVYSKWAAGLPPSLNCG